jgi:hypothetical protein
MPRSKKHAKADGIRWLDRPEDQDFPAAGSYLSLLYPPQRVRALVNALKRARPATFKAKDIFRASRLPLLGLDNWHVQKDHQKIAAKAQLSPLLLVRDPVVSRLIIADGYHRLCAVYSHDEDAVIPCRIV